MKKNLMYYVHKNRKDAWDKIAKIAAKTGEDIITVIKKSQTPQTKNSHLNQKKAI